MTKRNQDFSMFVGESKTIFIALSNEDGSPFDPAGNDFQWRLAKTAHSDPLITKRLGSGLVLVDGGIDVLLASEDTADLRPELYYHELQIRIGSTGLSVSTTGCLHLRAALDMRVMPMAKRKGAA